MMTVVALAYVLGSIPFALIVARWAGGADPRHVGSGNVGAANALRTTRPAIGFIVLVLDVSKGGAAVMSAAALTGQETVPAAVLLPGSVFLVGAGSGVLVAAVAAGALIVFRHRSNAARLLSGTERRLVVRRAEHRRPV